MGAMRDGATLTKRFSSTSPPDNSTPPTPPPPPRHLWRSGWLLLVGVVLVVFALFVVYRSVSRRPSVSGKEVNGIVDQKVSAAISALQSQPPVATQVYDQVRAGLVVIESQHHGAPDTEDLGTGIIVDTQGDILTALHVVEGGSAIKVTFSDGTVSAAIHQVVGPRPRHRRAHRRAAADGDRSRRARRRCADRRRDVRHRQSARPGRLAVRRGDLRARPLVPDGRTGGR